MLFDIQTYLNRFNRALSAIINPVASLTLRAAIIRAEANYLLTGNRQYVLPSQTRHKLLVTDFNHEIHSQGLAEVRRSGRHTRINRPGAMMDQAFYWTRSKKASITDRRPMSKPARSFRRQMFYSWWNHNTK